MAKEGVRRKGEEESNKSDKTEQFDRNIYRLPRAMKLATTTNFVLRRIRAIFFPKARNGLTCKKSLNPGLSTLRTGAKGSCTILFEVNKTR